MPELSHAERLRSKSLDKMLHNAANEHQENLVRDDLSKNSSAKQKQKDQQEGNFLSRLFGSKRLRLRTSVSKKDLTDTQITNSVSISPPQPETLLHISPPKPQQSLHFSTIPSSDPLEVSPRQRPPGKQKPPPPPPPDSIPPEFPTQISSKSSKLSTEGSGASDNNLQDFHPQTAAYASKPLQTPDCGLPKISPPEYPPPPQYSTNKKYSSPPSDFLPNNRYSNGPSGYSTNSRYSSPPSDFSTSKYSSSPSEYLPNEKYSNPPCEKSNTNKYSSPPSEYSNSTKYSNSDCGVPVLPPLPSNKSDIILKKNTSLGAIQYNEEKFHASVQNWSYATEGRVKSMVSLTGEVDDTFQTCNWSISTSVTIN